jgi:hypothetical protein
LCSRSSKAQEVYMMSDHFLSSLSDYQVRLLGIFHPYAMERTVKAFNSNTRFVHYTSAETALRMFEKEEVWMRNSSCMNDFMEIEHGFGCLNAALKSHEAKVKSALEALFPGLCDRVRGHFNSWLPHFRSNSYIACVSEHGDEATGDEEDRIGRLSMWRALLS